MISICTASIIANLVLLITTVVFLILFLNRNRRLKKVKGLTDVDKIPDGEWYDVGFVTYFGGNETQFFDLEATDVGDGLYNYRIIDEATRDQETGRDFFLIDEPKLPTGELKTGDVVKIRAANGSLLNFNVRIY